jgi:putative NIF3 family GTP cyclohydrolase 1 type 2
MHANASLDEMAAWLDQHLDAARYSASEPGANGLVYHAGPGISKFAVAVSASMTALVGAAKAGAQLLVVHHPSWPEIDLDLHDEKMGMLEAAGLSLYAAHASLDCAPQVGNGWVLASMLGVEVESTFADYHGGHAGVVGRATGDFAGLIQHAARELRVEIEAHEHARTFGRVAIVPGAGGMTADLAAARALGADTYVTGEGSLFTRMYAKDAGMNLLFGTHHATEAPGIRALGDRLSLESGMPFEFIDESSDVF